MEKPSIMISRTCCYDHQLGFATLISLLLCTIIVTHFNHSPSLELVFNNNGEQVDPCHGRYVYVHDLPPRFNRYLIDHCDSLTRGTDKPNMCPYMENMGFGPKLDSSSSKSPEIFTNSNWYETNQFSLELIFHHKIKNYKCLTNDSSVASAIFVPFYAGLDVSRFLWVSNLTVRDASGRDLARWLSCQKEWKRMWGRDHFVISGRISWDFRRQHNTLSDWGSNFRFLPESMNMSMLAVEGSSWNNDYAVPYPTSFHPLKESEIVEWQRKIRNRERPHLFTFTGAPRPEIEDSIRGKVIQHCRSSRACKFIDCSYGKEKCEDPVNVIMEFGDSVFCLQPPGDSYTRRSIFDSMVAGCVPVFFHPGTAYSQYRWNLPQNRTKYSVYIPVRDVKEWNEKNISVEKVLMAIPEDEVVALREEVIKLIPSIIYADPRSNIEDAFDLAVKGILERIERVREAIRNGRDPSIGFADEDHYKYTFSDHNHS
ncbi:probable xyloglucan galactosyltransferase GT14 [Arachis hypogaea]|uniref:Exostosin GT47 domain-containing protein n=1 Tax=Arachis hypogaea TaxID=3818 RepID=A0A445DKL8_ARAHY|nr:probable xyloglucan galactosyltransferase GT14 [Arachis hypogaea]QHO37047.1 uncharacterized protein DS421_4g108220 [Arachis hypogaea]RYR63710.1 hypothetical protein Ahy_A04g021480 [Arachis hypogaea]